VVEEHAGEAVGLAPQPDGGRGDADEHQAGQLADVGLGVAEEGEQGAGDERAAHRGDAAHEGEEHDDQAGHRLELGALHRPRGAAEEGAGAAGDEGGDREDGHLGGPHPHAERGRGQLAVADGGELPSEPGPPDGPDAHGHDGEDHRAPDRERSVGAGGDPQDLGAPDGQAAEAEDAVVAEDHLPPHQRDAEGAQRQVQAPQADRRQGDDRAHHGGDQATEEHAEHARAAEDRPGDERPQAHEQVVGERHLAGQAGEGDQGQGDDGDHQPADHVAVHVAGQQVHEQQHGRHQPDRRGHGAAQARHRGLVAPHHPAGGEAGAGDQQHRRDQEQAGYGQLDAHEHLAARPQPRHVGELLDQAEQEGADEGHRQAGEPPHHGGAVGVEHQQREDDGVEVLAAGEQHAAQARQREADHPADAGHAGGPHPVEPGQLAVVDHRTHAGTERAVEQQRAQAEGDGGGHEHLEHAVVRDGDAGDPDASLAEEERCVAGLAGIEQLGGQAEQADGERHRHHQRRGVVGAPEAPQQALGHQAHGRGQDHHDRQHRDWRGPAAVDPQVVVDERRHHPDGTVGEVEHAGHGVGEHQAHGRDGVDAAQHEAEQGELQQLGHPPAPR
jgi:hypothetical protein